MATLAYASWIHGHSVNVEEPGTVRLRRIGSHVEITGDRQTFNWLHFAIPSPVIVNGSRLKVGSVLLRFRMGTLSENYDTEVKAVHVYDGENKIASYDNLELRHSDWISERFLVPNNPPILWGLGISVNVSFIGIESDAIIEFSSAGCDFLL